MINTKDGPPSVVPEMPKMKSSLFGLERAPASGEGQGSCSAEVHEGRGLIG
jgi:hypothetical protein